MLRWFGLLLALLAGCTLRSTHHADALVPIDALVPDAAHDAQSTSGDAHRAVDAGVAMQD